MRSPERHLELALKQSVKPSELNEKELQMYKYGFISAMYECFYIKTPEEWMRLMRKYVDPEFWSTVDKYKHITGKEKSFDPK